MRFELSVAIATSLWLGFVLAISFMESWLKFRAKGVTIAIGLSIGRLVFRALNIMEWIAALALAVIYLRHSGFVPELSLLLSSTAVIILLFQTLLLLPALSKRARRVIAGETNTPSRIHLVYVATEVLKVAALLAVLVTL